MSQQGGSSMVSSSIPNSQVKYQKALKQISKLINTNKILKTESQERQQVLSVQFNEIAMRCDEMQRKYEQSESEKRRMQQFMEELQDTNQDLRKQYQTLERQVGYLNDVLTQQNAQLKKLSVFKDDKGISQLFRSYEEREDSYKQEVTRLQQHIVQLKTTIDRIEEDLMQETQMRQRYEDQYNNIGLQFNRYRQLNSDLMDRNQHILGDERNRNQRGLMSQHEVQGVVVELKRQLEVLRNVQYQNQDMSQKQYIKNYELLLQEKNTLALSLAKTKDQLSISEQRIKEMYEIEERMSTAIARSDILIQENNMLKNRITILESKEIIDSAGFDEDSDLKVFEDKINYMMTKTDPLHTIKNSDDNTHFITMKSFITDLQVKLQGVIQQRQSVQKKYKNLKLKFSKKAEEFIILEESHKLLKGKLEGYERLTEKLNYELERSMQAHEDEIVKMVAITNNLVSKKVEESKTASAFIKSQFDIEIQKAEKTQKTISQELETLKLQNSTLRIKLSDLQEKYRQSSQLMQIYQTKITQISSRYKELQQQNTSLNEKVIKFEQLYQEEKARHETILVQKQAVFNKLNLVSEELSQKAYTWEQALRQKELNSQSEIKRSRQQAQRFKEQTETLREENKRLSHELDQHRVSQNKNLSSVTEENLYLKELENKFAEVKQSNHLLETELVSLRNKIGTYDELKRHLENVEAELMKKNDDLNDLKRVNIGLKKEIQALELTNTDIREQNDHLIGQTNSLKSKLYHPPTMPTSTSKQLQSRKTIQRLHEQIAILESAIRDQKRVSARYLNELQHFREEIERLEEIINRNKQREQSLLESISQANNELMTVQDELFEYRSKCSQNAASTNSLSQDLDRAEQRIAELTEELTANKAKQNKVQANHEYLLRQVYSTRYYIQEADKMVKRLNGLERLEWEQQREKENIASLVDTFNRILKSTESVQHSNNSSNQEYSFVPASSFGNLESNFVVQSAADNAYTRVNFGGSFGSQEQSKNNIVTNDTFKVYAGSANSQTLTNVNFSSESFGRPSQQGNAYSPYGTFEQV